jgi:cystathionine beta-synthase
VNRLEHTDITSAIGDTPIVRLNKVPAHVSSEIYVKLEFMNPGGSIKDRAGVYMCRKAVERGDLPPGGIIIEATSGNTGVGVAIFANVHDHPCIFVMADKQSSDKVANLKAYGARVILCPAAARDDPRSHHSVARALAERLGALLLDQHSNPDNVEAHYAQTGPEILRQTGGELDALVVGVGTGGTVSGAGRFLKEHMPSLEVIGVDAQGSILARYYRSGATDGWTPYLLEGVGEGFVPPILDLGVVDAFEVVGDEEAFRMTRALLTEEGIFAGGSSGAAVVAAIRYAQRQPRARRILVVLPDSGSRYASQFYDDAWMEQHGWPVAPKADPLDERIQQIIGAAARLA